MKYVVKRFLRHITLIERSTNMSIYFDNRQFEKVEKSIWKVIDTDVSFEELSDLLEKLKENKDKTMNLTTLFSLHFLFWVAFVLSVSDSDGGFLPLAHKIFFAIILCIVSVHIGYYRYKYIMIYFKRHLYLEVSLKQKIEDKIQEMLSISPSIPDDRIVEFLQLRFDVRKETSRIIAKKILAQRKSIEKKQKKTKKNR